MAQPPTPGSPLVGRADELDSLHREIGLVSGPDQPSTAPQLVAAQQPSAAVLLGGDAGLGKTRLLAELRRDAEAAGWRVVVGHCLDFGETSLPYLPVSELFGVVARDDSALADRLLAEQPELARLMPGHRMLDGGQAVDRIGRAELVDAIHAGIELLATDAPLLVIIEDLHWADQSTRDLLTGLFTRPPRGQLAIVASYRSDDLHRRHPLRAALAEWTRLPSVRRITLKPLPDKDIRRIVRQLDPAREGALDVRRIVARAEGNAFFAEELVAAASREGGSSDNLPTDLADLLLVRLDRLDEAARQVVRAAAVAGRRVSHPLLAAVVSGVTGGGDVDAGIRTAVESNILVPIGDGYGFRHALLAEAVYDDLLPGERVHWHTAYVTALSGAGAQATAAELARHARATNDLSTALRASIEAGDEAMSVGGPGEATAHYEAALELLAMTAASAAATSSSGPAGAEALALAERRIELAIKAAEAASAAGRVHRAFELVKRELAELPPDTEPRQRARLLQATAAAAYLTDTGIDVLELTSEALSLLPADEISPLRARLANSHALASVERYRNDEAIRWLETATTLGRALGLPDVVAEAAVTRSFLDRLTGDPEGSRRALEATVASAQAAGESAAELRATFNLANLHYDQGQLADARATYERADALARQRGRRWAPYGVDARIMTAIVAFTAGDWAGALQIADTTDEDAPPLATAALEAVALLVAAGRGDLPAADQLPSMRTHWRHDLLVAILCTAAAIDLYGAAGDLASALAYHDEAIALGGQMWGPSSFQARIRFSALLIGQLASALGTAQADTRPTRTALLARGIELADAGRAVAAVGTEHGRHGVEGRAWLARLEAELARLQWLAGIDTPTFEELQSRWEAAVSGFERFGNSYETARSRARLAAVLRARGEAEPAHQQLQLARRTALALGATPLLDEIRALAPTGATSGAPHGADRLTAREVEVLALVAQGRSNGEIGKQLFISTKTASVHVSNILAKLGAGGRTEAAAIARRKGLLTD